MKKIWLRKEREDSKSLQEAKSELQSEVVTQLKPNNQDDNKHKTEDFTKQSSQEDSFIPTNNRLRPESGKLPNDENQEFPTGRVTHHDSRFTRLTPSTSSLHHPVDVLSIIPEKRLVSHADAGTTFSNTYFGTIDSHLVNSAYVLTLGRPDMSLVAPEDSRQQGFMPGAFAFFRVENPLSGFSFPSADSGGCFVVDHSGKREFAVNDQSIRRELREFKPHDQSKYCYEDLIANSQSQSYVMELDDRFRNDRPVFRQLAADARCAYPLVESISGSKNIVANRSLNNNTENFDNYHSYTTKVYPNISNNPIFSHSLSSFSPSTSLSSELATFRKRAPNSPLQIPVTPTTSNGSTPAAFVVPRQVSRLVNSVGRNPGDYGCDKSSRPQPTEAKPGSQVNALIPTMIADLNALEVNNHRMGRHDGKPGKDSKYLHKETEIVIVNDDSDPKVVGGDHGSVPNASKREERLGCYPVKDSVSASSDIPGIDWKTALNKKASNGIERKIRQHNSTNNNIGDNSNSLETQRLISQANPSFCTTSATSKTIQNFSVSVSNNSCKQPPTPTVASSSISLSSTTIQKEQQSFTPTVPLPARGKGRPAKVIGTEVCSSTGGSRSVIKCPICSKVFNNSSALAKHKLTHSDERKYSCHLCSKAFKRQDHLNGHMMTHSSKKPFECRFLGCSKSYCDARSLRRHLENHHQDSINSCHNSIGGEKIEISSAPVNHVDQLNPLPAVDGAGNLKEVWVPGYNPLDEPKPVRCHVCGRCFKNVPALNGHMRLHGGYVNRDLEEGGRNPPSEPNFSTHSNPIQADLLQKRLESADKTQLIQPRASSLESLPLLVPAPKCHYSRFKSHTLPREEQKNRDVRRSDGHDRRFQKNSGEADTETVTSKSRSYGHSVSSILDFSKEECQKLKSESYSNYPGLESQKRMPSDYSRQPTKMLVNKVQESNDLSCYHEIQEASFYNEGLDLHRALKVETDFSSDRFSDSTRVCFKPLPSLPNSQISPKHLEASSLYQRRRRRFSERSPNSEENSGQGTETSSVAASEKSYEDEIKDDQDCLNSKGFHDNIYSGCDNNDDSRTCNEVFSSLNVATHSVDLKNNQPLKEFSAKNSLDVIEPGEVRLHDIKSLRENCSFSSSHPAQVNIAQAYCVHETSKALQSSCFPASCEQGSNASSSAQVVITPNAHGFGESTSTVYQQSHSSLPCTPYTAHTPYTPRTTGPGSPKQASLFQFPPFYQHEGATPEESGGAKIPPDMGSAYVPEAFMGAKISLQNDHGLPEGASCPELAFKDSQRENVSWCYESVKAKKNVNYHCRSSRERRADIFLPERREKSELSERISELESIEKLDSGSKGKDFEKSANFHNKASGKFKMTEEQVKGNFDITKDNGAVAAGELEKFLQPLDRKKLSARRKACPAPLVLQPPSNLSVEKCFQYQSQLRSPRVLNSFMMSGTQGVNLSSFALPYTPPPMLSPVRSGTGLYWTTLQSAGSSVDSGCPKSSARFSIGSACSFSSQECLLPQTGDSLISYKFTPSNNAKAPNRTYSDDGATLYVEPRINVGDCFQASIPKFRGGVSCQKEKSELVCHPHESVKITSEKNERLNWSSMEVQMFSKAIMAVEKDFSKISKLVASKSTIECVEFYYTWKRSHLNDYERLKVRKRKEKPGQRFKKFTDIGLKKPCGVPKTLMAER